MKEKNTPMNIFVEPGNVFTNETLCQAIIDSGGNPVVENIRYKGKSVPTLEISTGLLKKAYSSAAGLNNKLKFKVYRKIEDNKFQLFEILKPRKRTGAKISKAMLKKLKEKKGG